MAVDRSLPGRDEQPHDRERKARPEPQGYLKGDGATQAVTEECHRSADARDIPGDLVGQLCHVRDESLVITILMTRILRDDQFDRRREHIQPATEEIRARPGAREAHEPHPSFRARHEDTEAVAVNGRMRRHFYALPACRPAWSSGRCCSAMATAIRRGPVKGSRPCAVSMLSTTSTSPCCQSKR